MSIFVMSLAYEHDPQILESTILLGPNRRLGAASESELFPRAKQTEKKLAIEFLNFSFFSFDSFYKFFSKIGFS